MTTKIPDEFVSRAGQTIEVDFLYLDLTTCSRCRGSDASLRAALETVRPVLETVGVSIEVRKTLVETEEQARALRFVSSPTIHVNGHDIAGELIESSCSECGELWKVRLENVRAILEKALDTLAEHPEILESLGKTLDALLEGLLGDARDTLEQLLEGLEVGDTVDDELLKGRLEDVRNILQDILESHGGGGTDTGALSEGPANDPGSSASERSDDNSS